MRTTHYRIRIIPKVLHFKQPAGTSRGTYTIRKSWYLVLTTDEMPGRFGIGECAPLPKLSCDDLPDYEKKLATICHQTEQNGMPDTEALRSYPSILFGLETAFRHFQTGNFALWDTDFSRGKAGIPINGLIWMGDYKKMLEQIEVKMQSGFRCIKLKIGAINFEEELALLKHIRAHFSAKEIELRVDANGAFSPDDALNKLQRLAELDLHSIEQPIRARTRLLSISAISHRQLVPFPSLKRICSPGFIRSTFFIWFTSGPVITASDSVKNSVSVKK